MHSPELSRQDTTTTAAVTAGDAVARYLHAQAADFLRSLRLHSESGADTAVAADAARALRQSSRRISGTLHTFRPLLDPAWADGLRAELAWLSATLAQEHAHTSRLDRLLEALSRLSGTAPLPSARIPYPPLGDARGTGAAAGGLAGPGRPAGPRDADSMAGDGAEGVTTPTGGGPGGPAAPADDLTGAGGAAAGTHGSGRTTGSGADRVPAPGGAASSADPGRSVGAAVPARSGEARPGTTHAASRSAGPGTSVSAEARRATGTLAVGAARAGALLERQLTLARTRAHSAALQALGSSRFHAVADAVALLASELPLAPAADGPAAPALALSAEIAERRLLEAVATLPLGRAAHPYNADALVNGLSTATAGDEQDAPWHQVRQLLRLHRYAQEVLHPDADQMLWHAGRVLDRHRDAAEAAAAAAAAARTPRIAPATAYALGVLHADQRHEVEAARFAFQQEWRRATAVSAP
ncbi:CHAD domain-containing protein [Streptomyces sp. NPDC002889]|uniref:CHAD domain-containing protein n=1 Tax=Streptomyces sp. NPDC002889 TaxID=3364669 RepID=UPI0036CF296C